MKKGLGKTLAAFVAGSMLLSMNFSAFAVTQTTQTSYDAATGKAKVTVNVTEAATTEEVAMLAFKGNDIVHIDQRTAVDGAAEFNFNISAEDAAAGNTTVKVGTTSTANTAVAALTQIADLGAYTVTVQVGAGAGLVALAGSGTVNDELATVAGNAYDSGQIVIYALPAEGYAVDSYQVGSAAAISAISDTIVIGGINADTTVTVNFKAVTTTGVTQVTVGNVTATGDGITLTGTVTGDGEYGMLLSKAAISADSTVSPWNRTFEADKVYGFKAYAKNSEGQFTVVLEDDATANYFDASAAYKVAAYGIKADDTMIVAQDN